MMQRICNYTKIWSKQPQCALSLSNTRKLSTQLKEDISDPRKKIDVTPINLRKSADKMLDYYTSLQLPSGEIKGYNDSCHYCKLPNGLIFGGRIDEADRLLDYCVNNFFQSNGDFMNNPNYKTLHWEFEDFYSYLNQWWITSGVRLGRFDYVYKAFEYINNEWYNEKTNSAIVQSSIKTNNYENCIFNSAHLGLTNLYLGKLDNAIKIGNTIIKMIKKQPKMNDSFDDPKFFMRFDDNFELITKYNKNDKGVKLAAIMNANKPNQCWWSLGYPTSYLAILYTITKDEKYLLNAEKILEFIINSCNDDIRNNIISHKVMWASSLVGNITGKKEYWDLCKDIAYHIMNEGQSKDKNDGRVLNWQWERGTDYGQAQIIDQTAEIAYWFHVVARQMEKAEIEGRLK